MNLQMSVEKCNNCEKEIGNLEPAYVFNGKIVCSKCNDIIRTEVPDKTATNKPEKITKKYIFLIVIGGIAVFSLSIISVAHFTHRTITSILQESFAAAIPLSIIAAILFGLTIKPIRKAVGLLLIILGVLECLSCIGMIIGVPSIIVGGVFIFS